MDFKQQHPLEKINGYNNLSMLEAFIPFVDYSLKLPLALFIKFNEIKLIIQTFQNHDLLENIGLHHASSKPTDFLCALTGMPPELFELLFNNAGTEGTGNLNSFFSNLSGFPDTIFSNQTTFENPSRKPNAPLDTSDIDNLFASYDEAQNQQKQTNTQKE